MSYVAKGLETSGDRCEWKFIGQLSRLQAARAKLAVAWTVDHVRRYNIGLVGGKLQLAVLERVGATWIAHHEDGGETEQQVQALETYVSGFREIQQPDTAAKSSTVDLHQEINEAAKRAAS